MKTVRLRLPGLAVFAAMFPALVSGQAIRTSWGAPDLQGIWGNPHVIPLQRPTEFGTRAFLTDEEIAAAEQELSEGTGKLRHAGLSENDLALGSGDASG